jgi:hypothetical protein
LSFNLNGILYEWNKKLNIAGRQLFTNYGNIDQSPGIP